MFPAGTSIFDGGRRPLGSGPGSRALTQAKRRGAARTIALNYKRFAAVKATKAAFDRRIRLWTTKDADGHRTDRDYAERPIRTGEPTLIAPAPYVEPTSRADLFSWATSRGEADSFPVIRPGARDISQLLAPTLPGTFADWRSDSYRRSQLVKSQGSSFIATRYGLCRVRERRIATGASYHIVTDLTPWGASINYPGAFIPNTLLGTSYPQALTNIKATQDSPWPFLGSGCLPLFYMDQPHPFVPPRASVIRDTERFGDTVRLKYRELTVCLEEFPYYNQIDPGTGRWNPPPPTVRDGAANTFGLTPMPVRPADRVRVILFSRKKVRARTDTGQDGLFVPLFPPKPAAGHVGSTSPWQADMTYDTPSNGERVFTYPSTAATSEVIIHEDVVLNYPRHRPEDLPSHGHAVGTSETSAGAAGLQTSPSNGFVFGNHNTVNPIQNNNAPPYLSTAMGTMSAVDADGLPHNRRKLYFRRKFKDDGRRLSWTLGAGEDQHEMTAPRTEESTVGYLRSGGDTANSTEEVSTVIDMCDRELFITVVSGAFIESRAWTAGTADAVAINAEGTNLDTSTLTRSVGNRCWRLSPANVCMPSLVSISTKMWYADEPLTSIPRSITVVDGAGVVTGRIRVRDVGSTIGGALVADQLPLGDFNAEISQLPQPPT